MTQKKTDRLAHPHPVTTDTTERTRWLPLTLTRRSTRGAHSKPKTISLNYISGEPVQDLLIFFGCHATSSYLIECLCLNRWKDWGFWYFINFSTGICVIFCICNIGNFFYTNVSTDCTSFLRNCCISGLCVNHVFNSCFNGV